MIFAPDKLKELSKAISKHISENEDPKCAMQIFILNPRSPFFDSPPGLGLQIFDGNGIEHAKSDAGFKWAWDLGPVHDGTSVQTFQAVNKQTEFTLPAFGKFVSHDTTCCFDEMDDQFLVRANDWFYRVLDADPSFATGSYCIIETNQRATLDSVKTTVRPLGRTKVTGISYRSQLAICPEMHILRPERWIF